MRTKQIITPAVDEQGVPTSQVLFGSYGVFEKVAGAPPFADFETGEQIRNYVSKLSRKDRQEHCYTLVNALSAGEYYSSNINADWFGWEDLSHEGRDYGYQTFMDAHAFEHHVNEEPSRALGLPVLPMINNTMKRVEVIVELHREKSRLEGSGDLVSRIDRGEFVPWSMGCKVRFDVCSICLHEAPTEEQYCIHMRPPPHLAHLFGPNKILPDGRKIFVRNPRPRFFDLSGVFIGAEKTAFSMAKLASPIYADPRSGFIGNSQELKRKASGIGIKPSWEEMKKETSDASYTKEAAAKVAEEIKKDTASLESIFGAQKTAQQKLSEIIKRVPADQFSKSLLPSIEVEEARHPLRGLIDLMKDLHVSHSLGHLAERGIVLQPSEFQRLILLKLGKGGMADELDSKQQVFQPSSSFDDSTEIDINCCGEIETCLGKAHDLLREAVKYRSSFGKPFTVRLMFHSRGMKTSEKPLPTSSNVKHPLLDKLGAAYNGYRRDVLMKLSQAAEVTQRDPRLREMFTGNGLSESFMKTASNFPIISLDSMKYLLGAHFTNRDIFSDSVTADVIAARNEWLLQEP